MLIMSDSSNKRGRPVGRAKRAFNTTLPADVHRMIATLQRTLTDVPGVSLSKNAVVEAAIRRLHDQVQQRGEAG
jgi:hypothetical protein